MSDLRDPMLDDLDGMFRRRERDVTGDPRFSLNTRRQVHRRQVATGALSVLATVAVISVVVVLLPRVPSAPTPLGATGEPTASTIQGVAITYPEDWHLVALPEITSDWVGQGPRSAFRPVFQLSNFDPVSEEEGFRWFCPVDLGGSFPDDGALLYVEAIGGPIAEGASPWPVAYPTASNQVASGGGCGGEEALDTSWTAEGVTYHGVVMGDMDDPAIRAAFDSLRFAGGTPAIPGDVDAGPLTSNAYVLASGERGLGTWNLVLRADDGCLAVAEEDGRVIWECNVEDRLELGGPFAEYRNGNVLFGPVAAGVARIEFQYDDGRIEEVQISALPPSFGDRRAFSFAAPLDLSGNLVAFDASGAMIGTALPTTTPSTPTPADALTSVVSFQGEDLGGVWSAEFGLDEEGRLCLTTTIDGDGESRCGDEPTFTFPVDEWLPAPRVGETMALAAGTLPNGFVSIQPGDGLDGWTFRAECLPGPNGAVPDRYVCVVVLAPSGQATFVFVGEDPTLIAESPIEWGDGYEQPPTASPIAHVTDGVVSLTAEDITWDVQRIEAPAGEPFRIDIANRDAGIPHNFVLFEPGGETRLVESEIGAGRSEQRVEVSALTPGTYAFRCDVHPTTMVGQIVVG